MKLSVIQLDGKAAGDVESTGDISKEESSWLGKGYCGPLVVISKVQGYTQPH